jgi:ppGpp synthetase/RelA/SpoT-type nucleotidyltranferase
VKSSQKLQEKYLDPKKDYRKLGEITDQAGLRIITYYEDEVDRVAKVIQKEFEIDFDNSVDKREMEPDRFGYRAINYVCTHSSKRTAHVEYRKFSGIVCEIQITSILSHAWSEIEHEWYDLKETYPKEIKRRFSRLIALLELAEVEFVDIRKFREQFEKSVAVRVEANVLDLPVNAISLRTFIEKEPLVIQMDRLVAAAAGLKYEDRIEDSSIEHKADPVNLAGMHKLEALRASLIKHGPAISEFVRRCTKEIWPPVYRETLTRGVSIFQLATLLLSASGKLPLTKLYRREDLEWDVERQIAVARETLAKL